MKKLKREAVTFMMNRALELAARRSLVIKGYDIKGVSDTIEIALQSVLDESGWTSLMDRMRVQAFAGRGPDEKYLNAFLYLLSDEGEPNMRDAVKGLLKPFLGKRPVAAGAGERDDEKEAASPRAGNKRKRAG